MDLAFEILEWAKDKKDLAEIYYEDASGGAPKLIHIVFDSTAQAAGMGDGSAGKALGYLRAPAIGRLTLQDQAKPGRAVKQGEELGYIEGISEKTPIASPFSGTIVQALADSGKNVGFGEPVFLVEINT